jgi:hypothetical protein
VTFTVANRCSGSCSRREYWDTPFDLECTSSVSCPNTLAPVHFSTFRLSAVTTSVLDAVAGTYRPVDSWQLNQTWLSTGDNVAPVGDDTSPNLWLISITHVGYGADGSTLAEQPVTFHQRAYPNRKDWGGGNPVAPYMHYRISSIDNGTGGQTVVAYNDSDCTNGGPTPAVDNNPMRCFAQFTRTSTGNVGWAWFMKYTVKSVTENDLTGGSPPEVWEYAYSTAGSSSGALWRHDTNESVLMKYRSWSDWVGYATVSSWHGPADGQRSVTTTQYYRGLDNDALNDLANDEVKWGTRHVVAKTGLTAVPDQPMGLVGSSGRCLDVPGSNTANECGSSWSWGRSVRRLTERRVRLSPWSAA